MNNDSYLEGIISVSLNCVLIRMTKIKNLNRSFLFQEFKESIINSGEKDLSQEILCLKYLNMKIKNKESNAH